MAPKQPKALPARTARKAPLAGQTANKQVRQLDEDGFIVHKKLRFGLRTLAYLVLVLAVFFWWMNEPDRVISRFLNALKRGDLDAANSMLEETSCFVTDGDSVYLRTGIGTDYGSDQPWSSELDSLDQNIEQLSHEIASAVLVREPYTFREWFRRQRAFHFSSRYLHTSPLGFANTNDGSGQKKSPYWSPTGTITYGENDTRFGWNIFRVSGNQIDVLER